MRQHFPTMCWPLGISKEGIEWDFTPIKYLSGLSRWKNRQWKRVNRIAKAIAEDDKKFWEAELEQATKRGLEIQRELDQQIERDRRLEEYQHAVEQAEVDRKRDDALTEKYLSQIADAIEKRRESDAAWKVKAEARLRKSDEQYTAVLVRLERNELLRRGVLKGRGPKRVTLDGTLEVI
jgi:hypothetical protein